MPAWRHWYHLTLTCYGQWLPGDPRGWRTRRHREHIEGDYKHPPEPSARAEQLLAYSVKTMTHAPASFPPDLLKTVADLLLASLAIQRIDAAALAVAATHVHLLAQCPLNNPKVIAGRCKQQVTRNLPRPGDGPWWAGDSHAQPITAETHFWRTFQYILDHRAQSAWVWSDETIPF